MVVIVVATDEIALYEASAAFVAVTVQDEPTEPSVSESVVPFREQLLPVPTTNEMVPVPDPPEVCKVRL